MGFVQGERRILQTQIKVCFSWFLKMKLSLEHQTGIAVDLYTSGGFPLPAFSHLYLKSQPHIFVHAQNVSVHKVKVSQFEVEFFRRVMNF